MKIKEQTRKLAVGCSKHCFEVADRTDEVSSKHGFEVVDETDEVNNHTYGKTTLTRFEEIFEEYKILFYLIMYIYANLKARCFHQASFLSMYTFHIVLITFGIHEFFSVLDAVCCWWFNPFEGIWNSQFTPLELTHGVIR